MAGKKNGVRTAPDTAKLAAEQLKKSKNPKVKKLAGSALSNRRK